jgi:hypothetical protein
VTLSPVASRNRARANLAGARGQLTNLVREGGSSLRHESRCSGGESAEEGREGASKRRTGGGRQRA